MKLSIDSLETVIDLSDSMITVVSFQDIHFFSKIVRAFFNSINNFESEIEVKLVDDKEKRIDIHSKMEIILNPLLIDFSNRRISSALAEKLKTELNLNIEARTKLEKNLLEIQEQLLDLLDDFNLPLKLDDFWDASRLTKSFSLGIEDNTPEMTQIEILCKYLTVVSELKIADYFCFVGLNDCLPEDELARFYQEALRNQVSVICIEHRDSFPEPNDYAKYIFIDKDYDEQIVYSFQRKPQICN